MNRWLALSLIVAVACSSCGRKPVVRKPVEVEEPAPVTPPPDKFGGQKMSETGAIRFVCQGSGGKHEEEEIEINRCPSCGLSNYFVQHEGAFWCYKCEKQLPMDALKCSKCGATANKPKIKHK
jgi:hypothetical protein